MANKIFHSSAVTFLDRTDERKLEVYISSNHPTVQIKNQNTNEYTPDWSITHLQLTATVYLDSALITPATVQWYTRIGTTETLVGSSAVLTVSTNVLSANPLITYICRVTYQNVNAIKEITFARTDTGLNGVDGVDGTGVTILGSYDTLSELQTAHPTGNPGEAYIIGGRLYVWAIADAQWEDVGQIQGPAGKDGAPAKLLVLNGTSQVFKFSGGSTTPSPAKIDITAQRINIPSTTTLTWTYNGSAIKPSYVAVSNDTISITGEDMPVNSLVVKASDGNVEDVFTIYKVSDGANGVKGDDASIAFLTNENISIAANSSGVINNTTTLNIITSVVAYSGTVKQMPTLGELIDIPSGMKITISDDTLLQEKQLAISFESGATLGSNASNSGTITIPVVSPVTTKLKLSWIKINTGATGATGTAGADAYTVLLTNEAHTFAGDVSNAVNGGTAETQILAYKGTTKQSVTIATVNGKTAGTADADTGITGLKFKCSATSGTDVKVIFTCTNAFVSPSGTIPIVLTVGGVTFTKMFTYSIAFKGNTGSTGSAGANGSPATAYWLVSSASVVQKSASGTVVLTPSTLTFTGKSQTGTSSPIDYGCRWIIDYSTDGSTYTNAYTSTANEATKTFTVDTTYRTIRVRMYLAGGTTTLLDEQIIPVVADGAIGTPGADAVTFQIYSSNGYALSTNTPTVTLQTFAYVGDVAITAGATYQWSVYSNSGWTALTGATNAYLTISRDDVEFSKSYMCKMTFNGVEYTSVVTVDDKNDENKVFTTKPSNYAVGDLWIVGIDYVPTGVEVGTLLRAEHTNTSYADADWITATKYDDKINSIQSDIDTYNQYFSFDSVNGVTISARDANGVASQFSTSLTNERLSFNYGNESIAYINGTKMNIKEAEIESPLTVTGKYSGSTMLQAPVINIGNFSIIVESNGSLSIVANT